MKVNEKTAPGIVMSFCVLFLVVILLLSTGITGDTDSITHYLFSRYAFKYPEHFLDHWAKPLFTLLSAPFSQFGMTGAMVFNILCGLLTAWLVYKIARKLLYDYSWVVILMVIFTPVYMVNMYTSLTEILFSLVLIASIYLFLYERYILSALVISFIPFARSEGLMFLPLFLVAFTWMRKFRAVPFLFAGFLVLSLLGMFKYESFWWFFTAMPYNTTSESVYGSGSFFYYLERFPQIMGYPLIILSLIGTGTIFKWFISDRKLYRDVGWTTEYLLILPAFYGYILVQSFLWWQGMLGVMASDRFMACILPLGALIALAGFNIIINNVSYNRVVRNRVGFLVMLAILVMPFVYFKIPFVARSSYFTIEQAADWYETSTYNDRYVYYFDPSVAFFLEKDPWDHDRSMQLHPDTKYPERSYANGSVIFWENSFGAFESGLSFKKLLDNPFFNLLNVFVPQKDFSSTSGEYYLVAVFEKLPSARPIKEFILFSCFDFEENIPDEQSQNLTDSTFVSPGNSYRMNGKGFSPGLEYSMNDLPGKENVLIRISGKFNMESGFPEGKIILALEIHDEQGRLYRHLSVSNEQDHKVGEWIELSFLTGINKTVTEKGSIKIYAWNQAEEEVLVDDLEIKYYPME